jgi:hypothetical protein
MHAKLVHSKVRVRKGADFRWIGALDAKREVIH